MVFTFIVLIGPKNPRMVGCLGFVIKEPEVLPKDTKVQIIGYTYTLLEDAKIDSNQRHLNNILMVQKDFQNGINVISSNSLKSSTNL